MRSTLLPLLVVAIVAFAGCQTTTTVKGQPVPRDLNEADPVKRAQVRLELAATYYAQRQYPVALEETQRALQANPNSAAAHAMLGLIYMDLGDRANAEASFGRALRIEPDNPEINNNYGWFMCRTGREKGAIVHFDRAAANKLYATPSLALLNAGSCLLQVRDFAGAETYLRRSFEIDAGNARVKFQLARLYLASRQLERAGFYFGLVERDVGPTAEVAWLGLLLARALGDVRGERQYAEVLRGRFPSSPEAALLRRGAFDE